MVQKAEESAKDRKGICQKQSCENEILEALLEEPLGTTQLIKKSKYAKMTVIKYIRTLLKDKKIAYKDKRVAFGKREYPFCLTLKGEQEAKKQGFVKTIQKLPIEIVREVIMNNKLVALDYLIEISNTSHIKVLTKNSPYEKFRIIKPEKQIKYHMSIPFNIPTIDENWLKEDARGSILPIVPFKKKREKAIITIDVIEKVLRSYNFNEIEILKMWIIHKGWLIAEVLRFRSQFSNREPTREEIRFDEG